MNGDDELDTVGDNGGLAAHFADRKRAPRQAARSGDAERDDDRRLDQMALKEEPDLAAFDCAIVRTLMQATFATHFVLKMFHRIGDEGFLSRDARVLQRL